MAALTRCHSVGLSMSSAITSGLSFTPSTKPPSTSPTTASNTACDVGTSYLARYSDVSSSKVCSPSRRCQTNQPAGERRW
jgi:hypothetical protein